MKIENIDEGQEAAGKAMRAWRKVSKFLTRAQGQFGSVDIENMSPEEKQAANAKFEERRDAAYQAVLDFRVVDEAE